MYLHLSHFLPLVVNRVILLLYIPLSILFYYTPIIIGHINNYENICMYKLSVRAFSLSYLKPQKMQNR